MNDNASELENRLQRLIRERDQLEQALPPHGLKPGHLQKLEELEDQIEELQAQLRGET
jgi:chaperonin cofactor prefoldin